MKSLSMLAVSTLSLLLAPHTAARAQWDDGYWFLEFSDTTGAALQPLNVGIDLGDGSGYSFVTLPDDDSDGVIQLPLVPNNGGLVMGVDMDAEVGCDLWDFTGSSVSGGTQTQIHRPLLIIAEDFEGEALGMDSGAFPLPPLRTLVPGERLTATDGRLAEWPDLRLAIGPDPADLPDFLRSVDTWPNFTGDVLVSNFMLTGTFVPEPGSMALVVLGLIGITISRRNLFAVHQWQPFGIVDDVM